MSKFFKKTFIKLKPEIAAGVCPHCDEMSRFVSIVNDSYRCMNCGFDVEQKINGVIRYLPLGQNKIMEHEPKEG
jgi:Zn ribbon nucleic-acid-binding protein